MADGHGDERLGGAGDPEPEGAPTPPDETAADDEHTRMAAALDGIEGVLDDVASSIARMA